MARVTIDFTPAVHQSAGIGRLTREVIRSLLCIQSPHIFKLFCMGSAGLAQALVDMPSVPVVVCPFSDRWMFRVWFRARIPLPLETFAGKCDLYHATDFALPPVLPGTRTVLTVHDLSFERDPDSAQPQLLSFLKRVAPQSARRATHIVADSHATARDLVELYGIAPEKITTIHSGVDKRFSPLVAGATQEREVTGLRAKYDIGDAPFILTVGTMQKRKNHLSLVRAFAQVITRLPTGPSYASLQLVVAGGKGWLYDEVLAEVQKIGISHRVRFIGFVDDADLPALYRAAAMFAFPSLYEGFGLPLLEAMACGVPVVSSQASSLPEVVGDAGLMVAPLDIDALAAALEHALVDADWRRQAIQKGVARAGEFSWRRAAEQLLSVYDQVLSQR
jgi:glycosyltransferase involved in cell wall biosynthesis